MLSWFTGTDTAPGPDLEEFGISSCMRLLASKNRVGPGGVAVACGCGLTTRKPNGLRVSALNAGSRCAPRGGMVGWIFKLLVPSRSASPNNPTDLPPVWEGWYVPGLLGLGVSILPRPHHSTSGCADVLDAENGDKCSDAQDDEHSDDNAAIVRHTARVIER